MRRHSARRTLITGAAAVALVIGAAPAAMADTVRDSQWYLKYLNIEAAHKITKGAGVTVAVIDTGVDGSHPDLTGNVLPGLDDAIKPASPANGWVDSDGHGTSMGGIIAGHGRGGGSEGILGIAPEAKILPVRTKNKEGDLSQTGQKAFDVIRAGGAKVLNLSYGRDVSASMQYLLDQALDNDVSIVAAVGNLPDATEVKFPANHPGVIAVAGVDRNGNHSKISVTGPRVVLSAPSDDIISTRPNGGTGVADGTSNATAIVSGAVALLRAKFPDLPQREIANRLIATAIDKGPPGRDDQYGYGVIDINAALTADIPLKDPAAAKKSTDAAPPPSEVGNGIDDGSSTGLFVGLAVGVVVLIGLVILIVVLSRRRKSTIGPPAAPGPYPGQFPHQHGGPHQQQQYPAGPQYQPGPGPQYPPGPPQFGPPPGQQPGHHS